MKESITLSIKKGIRGGQGSPAASKMTEEQITDRLKQIFGGYNMKKDISEGVKMVT